MTDRRPTDHLADDEALSAYLHGDLDDDAAAAFEARLAGEPALAHRLDVLADALVALRGADHVEPPEGFDERLRRRLGPAPLDELAQRRQQRGRGWWMSVGTAAAVLVVGAVMSFGTLLQRTGDDVVATAGSGESADMAADGAEAGPPDGPLVVTSNAVIAGQAQLRRRYADLPEVDALLGTDADDAVQVAAAYASGVPDELSEQRASLESAPQNSTSNAAPEALEEEGAAAGSAKEQPDDPDAAGDEEQGRDARRAGAANARACLDTITAGAEQPLVPARIETVRYEGTPAIAYVLVTATPGSERLDRTEVWVVAQDDCATLVFQQS